MGRRLLSVVAKRAGSIHSRPPAAIADSCIESAGATGWSVMEHVVFSAAEGGVGEEFRRVSSLEEAVRVVEHLRNDLGITESFVYSLTPVPLEFKAYYRVEVPGAMMPAAPIAAVEAPISEIDELRVGDLSELAPGDAPQMVPELAMEMAPEPSAPELPLAEFAEALGEPESAESALTDQDFMPDFAGSDPSVASMLPSADVIPSSRQDADAERSLGYFAR
jgi:hypothetical protein